ncbi:hypothetical protein M3Y99_01097700 [Aphelenchoides fujianensis]|nr:hypothetical protein M3Y99_01097700 [Aphelenchoides fujianensis]
MSRVGLFGQISEINDHLFLSGAGVLRPEKLKQKKITCVINIRIDDNPYAHLDHYFDMVADKIRGIKERGGRTLVHCMAGSEPLGLALHHLPRQMVEYEKKLRGHNSVQMLMIDGCDMPVPDVYANELRRQVAYRSALSNANSRSSDDEGGSQRAKNADSSRYRSSGMSSPWRQATALSLLSPAPSRRARQENLFSNLYASRGAFFSAF